MSYFVKIALFKRAGERDVPEAAYFGPVARRVKGLKSATERSQDGGANVTSAICRFPALNLSFVNLIPSIFTVNVLTDRIKRPINVECRVNEEGVLW